MRRMVVANVLWLLACCAPVVVCTARAAPVPFPRAAPPPPGLAGAWRADAGPGATYRVTLLPCGAYFCELWDRAGPTGDRWCGTWAACRATGGVVVRERRLAPGDCPGPGEWEWRPALRR